MADAKIIRSSSSCHYHHRRELLQGLLCGQLRWREDYKLIKAYFWGYFNASFVRLLLQVNQFFSQLQILWRELLCTIRTYIYWYRLTKDGRVLGDWLVVANVFRNSVSAVRGGLDVDGVDDLQALHSVQKSSSKS